MILMLASQNDLAAKNILGYLLSTYSFTEFKKQSDFGNLYQLNEMDLLEINQEIVTADLTSIEHEFNPKLIIVLSRHSAESGQPALLAHAQGNWTEQVLLGGCPETLSMTSATALKLVMEKIREQKEEYKLNDFLCGLEVTHHGPFTSTPMIFVEIGSSEKQWKQAEPAIAVGEAAMYTAKNWPKKYPSVIGIGGSHYAPRFNKLIQCTDFAISHIVPKYALDTLNFAKMLNQAVEKTFEKIEILAYDHGGIKSAHRKLAQEVADNLGLEFIRVRDLLKLSS